MEKVLITGASGFLGRHIVDALSDQYIVHTLSRQATSEYPVDISMQAPLIDEEYGIVVHAAGKAHQLDGIQDTEAFLQVNVNGTHRLCEAFDRSSSYPKQFVFISSVSVYGLDEGVLIDESQPLNGTSAYAKSKIEAENILRDWCGKHNVKLSILRLPLIAGPNPPGNLGAMIDAIQRHRYFTIGKGDVRKSIVLASDVANWLPKIAAVGGTYHLTDNCHPSFADLAASIAKQLGKNTPASIPSWIAHSLAFAGDCLGNKFVLNSSKLRKITSTLTFDDSRARNEFGWKPLPVLEHFTIT